MGKKSERQTERTEQKKYQKGRGNGVWQKRRKCRKIGEKKSTGEKYKGREEHRQITFLKIQEKSRTQRQNKELYFFGGGGEKKKEEVRQRESQVWCSKINGKDIFIHEKCTDRPGVKHMLKCLAEQWQSKNIQRSGEVRQEWTRSSTFKEKVRK